MRGVADAFKSGFPNAARSVLCSRYARAFFMRIWGMDTKSPRKYTWPRRIKILWSLVRALPDAIEIFTSNEKAMAAAQIIRFFIGVVELSIAIRHLACWRSGGRSGTHS